MERPIKREMSVNTDHIEEPSYYCSKQSWYPTVSNNIIVQRRKTVLMPVLIKR